MKKLFALILSAAMLLGICPLAGAEGAPDVTSGWWLLNDSEITLKCFYHFNEDGTWYGYFFDGGVVQAGTYEIIDGIPYISDKGADGQFNTEDDVKATSDYAIACKTYDGKEINLAVVGDTMPDAELGGMTSNRVLEHKKDYAYVAKNEEVPIALYVFYADNRVGASMTLYHDHTYVEFASEMGDEGTWSTEDNITFTLTSSWDGEASLVVSGGSATYTTADGTEIAMADTVTSDGPVQVFEAKEADVGLPMGVDVRIACYDDGTCKLLVYVAAVDATLEADAGTYTVEGGFNYAFQFEKAGEIAGVPDYGSATATSINVTVPYDQDVTVVFMDNETPLSIHLKLPGTIVVAQ